MILLDTCALVWIVGGDPLEPSAKRLIRQSVTAGELFLSPITAWEIGVLARKGRLELAIPAERYVARAFSRSGFRTAPMTPGIAVRSSQLPGNFQNDPADRILLSTAIELGLTLVTRDKPILEYARQGHVRAAAC